MEERLARVETKVDAVDKKVDAVDKRVDEVDKKVDALANATRIQFEQVREDIKKLGEGYEQGLKNISNQIKELDQSWAAKWWPHELALKDHAKRITVLEQNRD